MSANPFLKRVLGEDIEMPDADTVPADDAPEPADNSTAPIEDVEPEPISGENAPTIPATQLAQMWRAGQQMDVATELMFTPASYADFVDLVFIIGQAEGRKLGHMLDELADSENIPVPEPSSDYSSVLQRVGANREHSTLVPE